MKGPLTPPSHRTPTRCTRPARRPALPLQSLAHAERAILLLQRQLWALGVSFQEGLQQLCKVRGARQEGA